MPDQSQLPEDGFVHVPVLAAPLLQALAASADAPWQNGLLIDATLGGAGHSSLLLDRYPGLQLIGLDQDATARSAASERLRPYGERAIVVATAATPPMRETASASCAAPRPALRQGSRAPLPRTAPVRQRAATARTSWARLVFRRRPTYLSINQHLDLLKHHNRLIYVV